MAKIFERMKAARKLAEFLLALAQAILRFVRKLFGIAGEVGELLAGDARSVWRGARAVNEGVGKALDLTVGKPGMALARTASGTVLGTAGFVGRFLGAVLPQRPATPAQLAAQVAAADTARTRNDAPAYSPQPAARRLEDLSMPALVRQYAGAGLREDGVMRVTALHAQRPLPPETMQWLESLEPVARRRVAIADPASIERHMTARGPGDLLPGVPPCPKSADVKAGLAAARAAFRVEKAAIAAGTAPAPAEPEARPVRRPFEDLEDTDLGAAYVR
ncbi:hypothetical protein [Methylobacterium tarhaniae]|uniref:hypothetical protein n=1 Tax=Methylobacterium tarhaniae TaxID=1187852 RepID=UPI0012ED8747|nr:hypothetical protein [Methylobacterium tarhaniae]